MRAAIFTEAGGRIGMGHLSRARSLRAAFAERDVAADVVVQAHDDATAKRIDPRATTLLNWADDADAALRRAGDADIIAVDSYQAEAAIYEALAATKKTCLWLDDHNRLPYPPGVIVNGAPNAVGIDYDYESDCEYLLGPKYLTLRTAFWNLPQRVVRDDAKTVQVAFGATDPYGLAKRVLPAMIGEFAELDFLASAPGMTAEQMLECMQSVDVAVSAGGQTLCELAATGTPTAAVLLDEDQQANVDGWRHVGLVELAGQANDAALVDSLLAVVGRLLDGGRRREIAQIAHEIMGACNATNVVDIALAVASGKGASIDVTVRPANVTDSCDLWAWRNHPSVQRWCCRQDDILYADHRQWFRKRLADRQTVLYVGEDACGVSVGQIRFDIDGPAAEANVNLSPAQLHRGRGRRLIAAGTRALLNDRTDVQTVDALIFTDNEPSQRAFAKAKYTPAGQTQRDGRNLLIYRYARDGA